MAASVVRLRGRRKASYCGALWPESHNCEQDCRSNLSVHDGRLGRSNLNGPILILRDAELDWAQRSLRRRVCLRYRPRPAWDHHQERGVSAAKPLPFGRNFLSLPAPGELEQDCHGRQNGRQQPDDRSPHGNARPEALRGAGRFQMVCARPARRLARLWRGRKCRRSFHPARWQRLDDRQGWDYPRAPIGGDHRADGPRSRRNLPRACAPVRRTCLRSCRGAGEPGAKAKAIATLCTADSVSGVGRRENPEYPIPGSRQRRGYWRREGDTPSGWFAARPSGTEDIYKIYAESFRGVDHLQRILAEAQSIVDAALALPT